MSSEGCPADAKRIGACARARVIWSNNLMVMATVVLTVMLAGGIVGLLVMFTDDRPNDGGALFALVLLVLCTGYGFLDLWFRSGGSATLSSFAEANDLVHLPHGMARDYAAGQFATGSHLVHEGVRTRGVAFVEVGNRLRTARIRQDNHPEVYLRVRLPHVPERPLLVDDLVDPSLRAALAEQAGNFTVECIGAEVTVLGDRELDIGDLQSVDEALRVAAEVRTRALFAAPTGTPLPEEEPPTPGRRLVAPLGTVALVIGLLVAFPLLIALVMSSIDGFLRGNRIAAVLVVGVIVAGALALVGALVRLISRRR